MAKLIVYMPALNEEKNIESVIESIPKEFDGVHEALVVVVDDGSSDDTAVAAERAGAVVIRHRMNKGVGAAFHTAVNESLSRSADILCSIDADGQFDARQIQNMIDPILSGKADFCIGNRFHRKRHKYMPRLKYWGNHLINKIVSWVSGVNIKDASCGFRAYSKECLISLNLQGRYTYTHETILDLINKGFVVDHISTAVEYYPDRVSRVAGSLIKYSFNSIKIIIKCLKDYSPFYFFGFISLFVFLSGIIPGLFVLYHWIVSGQISPYKSFGLISIILCVIATVFLVLALIADMLGRIRDNQEKLLYLLKNIHLKNYRNSNILIKDKDTDQ